VKGEIRVFSAMAKTVASTTKAMAEKVVPPSG